MELKCTNPECGRKWIYKGKKKYPSYASCPDCHRNIKLPEEKDD